jgi:hypothetical protein
MNVSRLPSKVFCILTRSTSIAFGTKIGVSTSWRSAQAVFTLWWLSSQIIYPSEVEALESLETAKARDFDESTEGHLDIWARQDMQIGTPTSGCQNLWRNTGFQCTITYGTFIKRGAGTFQIVPQVREHLTMEEGSYALNIHQAIVH